MPIEIKELHIKINASENNGIGGEDANESFDRTERIVEACVEQVMEILERKKER